MKKIMDFLRKIGILRVSSGDATTGEFDDRKDLKKEETVEVPPAEEKPEMASEEPEEKKDEMM